MVGEIPFEASSPANAESTREARVHVCSCNYNGAYDLKPLLRMGG